MAFNPFTSFRKHQKFWMAGAVLVCMMTFVLCSGGIRGTGLDDLLMNMFGRRHGEVMVQANGRKYYSDDLSRTQEPAQHRQRVHARACSRLAFSVLHRAWRS